MFNSEIGKAFYRDMLFGHRTGKESKVLRKVYDTNLREQPPDRQMEALQARIAQLEQQLEKD